MILATFKQKHKQPKYFKYILITYTENNLKDSDILYN